MISTSLWTRIYVVRARIFLGLFSVWVVTGAAAEKESPPRIADLIRAGQQTIEKFQETPASWRVRYRMPNGFMMDLDGKLTDLRRGDWPVVLRETRRILYKDDKSDLWHTCELDGTKPQLFADGLARHGTPAVSPDETKVIFARYEKGKLPELLLFELGKAQGRPITTASGFTGTPIWR